MADGDVQVKLKDLPMLPADLAALFEQSELKKYLSEEEYAQLPKEVA